MDQLRLVDSRILAVVMVSIEVGRPIEIDDLVDFDIVIAVWRLQNDHFGAVDAVIAVAERTIVANSTLECFHDLCDIPISPK